MSNRRRLAVASVVVVIAAALPAPAVGAPSGRVALAPGNGSSIDPAVSHDGRYVAFASDASNLVPGDTNGVSDVFVRDRMTSTTRRVSVSSRGREAHGASTDPAISADGRYVVFTSQAPNLVAHDTNQVADVFVRDTRNGTTRRVSVSSTGAQGNDSSEMPDISADGSTVVFASLASNLIPSDTNGSIDVFRHVLSTGRTARVSVTNAGRQGKGSSWQPAVSGNGTRVAFESTAALTPPPGPVLEGWYGVHVRDTAARTTRLLLWADGAAECGPFFGPSSISANGRSVVTVVMQGCDTDKHALTQVRLDGKPGHSFDARDFFYGFLSPGAQDATGALVAYHEDSDGGTPATTRKVIALRNWGTGAEQTLAVTSAGGVDLSGDGRTLVFSTGDALVGSDTNATADIYVWTPSTGALRLISGH